MPIVSFRVTTEVHESLIKLAETRNQTLTALMQETASHIVERTQAGMSQRPSVGAIATLRTPPRGPAEPGTWGARAPYGSLAKKDKGSK